MFVSENVDELVSAGVTAGVGVGVAVAVGVAVGVGVAVAVGVDVAVGVGVAVGVSVGVGDDVGVGVSFDCSRSDRHPLTDESVPASASPPQRKHARRVEELEGSRCDILVKIGGSCINAFYPII
jgi:hypothetical protein